MVRRARTTCGLFLALAGACLPDNPAVDTDATTTASGGTTADPTGGMSGGLFACAAPPCTVLLVSQTLDDRIDVFDVTAEPYLRGRIGTDLKPDPSGAQTMGNLLDEPYGLALDKTYLWAAIGHYPDTDRGSLLAFPRAGFTDLAGGVFDESLYFQAGSFTAGVQSVSLERREAIFLLPHPSGRLLVGVFANDIRATDWTTPSQVLVIDPADLQAFGAFDLDLAMAPCKGGWRLEALDDGAQKIGVACDGSESIAALTLPADFATAPAASAAAGITACGLDLGGAGTWSTQFVSADGAGGMLAIQSQLIDPPRLWSINSSCTPRGAPGSDLPPALSSLRLLREPALVRPGGGGKDPMWLVAAGLPAPGVVLVRGGASPTVCGAVTGLDALDAANNAPWSLALEPSRTHVAIGAGPASNPELAEGKGQVLWASLDLAALDNCEAAATGVVDLSSSAFLSADPHTWVRAPNVLRIEALEGDG